MGVHIEWNPNLERDLKKEVDRNLGPAVEEKIRGVKCDDHPEHQFRVVREEGTWHMVICCQRGGDKAAAAAGLNVKWRDEPAAE
jgi:hypothetical protein